jgi:hypothetical protein
MQGNDGWQSQSIAVIYHTPIYRSFVCLQKVKKKKKKGRKKKEAVRIVLP